MIFQNFTPIGIGPYMLFYHMVNLIVGSNSTGVELGDILYALRTFKLLARIFNKWDIFIYMKDIELSGNFIIFFNLNVF